MIWIVSHAESTQAGELLRIDALGRTVRSFPILIGQLPAGLRIGGLLGLDFFRDTRLTIDFRARVVSVS